jgi:ABC-type dipeptide/oligopeptide/nickel transport system permease component
MLEVTHTDYVRTAHSKGLDEQRIVTRHMFRNALVPLITIAGPLLGLLITGSIVVEQVFRIPGMGQLYWIALQQRNYGVVMGLTVIFAAAVVIMNAIVDLAYGFIDPRIRDGVYADAGG